MREAACGEWTLWTIHNPNRAAKYEKLGRPLKQTISFIKLWKQGGLVRSVKVPENLRTDEFFLGDFGIAKKIDDDNDTTQQGYPPLQFWSPERLHGKDPSFACDMWSYMVIFSVLCIRFPPFPTCFQGGLIGSMVDTLGPLPKEWKDLYIWHPGSDSWYDQEQMPNLDYDLDSIITRFRPDIDPIEREHVYSIMSRVFIYCPRNV